MAYVFAFFTAGIEGKGGTLWRAKKFCKVSENFGGENSLRVVALGHVRVYCIVVENSTKWSKILWGQTYWRVEKWMVILGLKRLWVAIGREVINIWSGALLGLKIFWGWDKVAPATISQN